LAAEAPSIKLGSDELGHQRVKRLAPNTGHVHPPPKTAPHPAAPANEGSGAAVRCMGFRPAVNAARFEIHSGMIDGFPKAPCSKTRSGNVLGS